MAEDATNLRAQPRLDFKWLKIDLQTALETQDGLSHLWNGLIQDGELTGAFSEGLLNSSGVLTCPCCDGICGPHVGCNCQPCQKLDAEESTKKQHIKSPLASPQFLLDSWTWGLQPTKEQLSMCLSSLKAEQQKLCSQAASTCLSATRLQQRLIVFKRYFIALSRATNPTDKPGNEKKAPETTNKAAMKLFNNISSNSNTNTSVMDPTMGLARVGSRAALNFSFAFLKRAWRLGEDVDICSELLKESLDALQILPVGTLFDEASVSVVWLEVVERSAKFLRQVVTGDVT